MSLTQSVFSETFLRLDSMEFFFFKVKLFVLFGVYSSEGVSTEPSRKCFATGTRRGGATILSAGLGGGERMKGLEGGSACELISRFFRSTRLASLDLLLSSPCSALETEAC